MISHSYPPGRKSTSVPAIHARFLRRAFPHLQRPLWPGSGGRGTKRCFFRSWSQFPLKHIDAVRRGRSCRDYPGSQPIFTTDWHYYHGKTWALSDLLKGIRFLGRGAEPGTQTHIFELRALSKHKVPLAPCQRWVCRAPLARGWAAISKVRCWVREFLLSVLLTQQFHMISSFWVIALLMHSSTNIPLSWEHLLSGTIWKLLF